MQLTMETIQTQIVVQTLLFETDRFGKLQRCKYLNIICVAVF